MNAPVIRQLDARLQTICKKHIEDFRRSTPKPKWPSRTAVQKEIERHDFHTIGISTILDGFFNDNPVIVTEAIATPLMVAYIEADRVRELVLIEFEKFLREVRTKYRDRIIFDGEAAILLIGDFERFDAVAEFNKRLS